MTLPMRAALLYLLLASIYPLFVPHAEFMVDDWNSVSQFEAAREAGWRQQVELGIKVRSPTWRLWVQVMAIQRTSFDN